MDASKVKKGQNAHLLCLNFLRFRASLIIFFQIEKIISGCYKPIYSMLNSRDLKQRIKKWLVQYEAVL